jgi:hypothetical protein
MNYRVCWLDTITGTAQWQDYSTVAIALDVVRKLRAIKVGVSEIRLFVELVDVRPEE